jgi:hypothetical protein
MTHEQQTLCRYFVSYSGVKLPLKLVNEINEEGLNNRNTYYRAFFDAQEKMLCCQKVVYGEVELQHDYQYDEHGVLRHAKIAEDDEVRDLYFDELGAMVSA